jgi:hypothetical protein
MNISDAENAVEGWAITVAAYYRSLIRNNVPDDLARELTLEWQIQQLKTIAKSNRKEVKHERRGRM